MNNKGYTLVELLATVVILGIIMGIATYGVIGVINNSKEKSEKVFVENLENVIKSYINEARFTNNWETSDLGKTFFKCRRVNETDESCYSEDDKREVSLYKITNSVKLGDLQAEKYIKGGKIINPKNKEECLKNSKNPEILLYKDSDSVYYYYVDLRGDNTSCSVDDGNAIISNMTKSVCDILGWDYNSDKVCVKR